MRKSNKYIKMISYIISIILISVLIGISFAYFTANSNDSNKQKISIENGSIELTYTDCINKEDCSNISGELEPGDSISKTFSVKSTGTLDTRFRILFSKSSNTFVNNELIYTLYNSDDNTEITSGTVPYGDKTNSYIYIESIKPSETKNYKIIITFKNLESGNNESNKEGTFSINLGIQGYPSNVWDFDYSENVRTFSVSNTGVYKLEVWGAKGSDADCVGERNYKNDLTGGYGGYSVGQIKLNANDKLYIYVGKKGFSAINDNRSLGGDALHCVGTGGGATYINSIQSKLSKLENSKDNIYIVAGGGGGAYYHTSGSGGSGGSGGGISGNNGTADHNKLPCTGGTQIKGGNGLGKGSFGEAGKWYFNGIYSSGGEGYYGGGSPGSGHDNFNIVGSGGGSGYIGNSLLTDKHMAGYNVEASDEESTKTISVTCASETPTSDCAKIGNGYARITYLGNKLTN